MAERRAPYAPEYRGQVVIGVRDAIALREAGEHGT